MKWYDIFSNFYDSSLEKLYSDSRKRAIELLDLKSGQVILDVACGSGRHSLYLNAKGHFLTCIDRNLSALRDRELPNGINLIEADIENNPWPLQNRQFDGDISLSSR